jgi:hypothetical protein
MATKLPPPGLFACRRAIDTLKRFQDLVRHYMPLPPDIDFARPLSELIPAGTKKEHEHSTIEQQINRLAPRVSRDLALAGIDTHVSLSKWEEKEFGGLEMEKVSLDQDLIGNYFDMQHGGSSLQTHRMLMYAIEEGIGVYESFKSAAMRRMFNPITWVAAVVRLPITILERAGVESGEASSGVVKAYGLLLRVLMLVIVLFIAAKLGISIPWEKLFAFLK